MSTNNSILCANARTAARFIFAAAALMLLVLPNSAVAQTSTKLQSLVNETAAQFKMAFRHDTQEHRARYEQLSRALAEWKRAPRGEEKDRLLADWLRAAIGRSMPGSREPLPPLPDFKRPTQELAPAHTPTTDKLIGDPFGDDPIEPHEPI
jgi:hypothetical protein